jgi:transposase
MVFRKISPELKEHTIWLWENHYLTKEIEEITGVSIRSVQRWRDNLDQYGSVLLPRNPLQGCPSMLTGEELHEMLSKVNAEPWMFLDEIQEWVTLTTEKAISPQRIHQILRDVGFTFKILRKQAAECNEDWRAEFRLWSRENLTVSQIIAIDESSKDDRTLF